MFYKKKGIPEENELVICTVKKIIPHSVFVSLDEYDNKEAMIHISEVSPGRIRNIRDFIRENKVIVCKVLKVHEGKSHIDLSLRRVSLQQRKKKEEEHKQEQKSEKLIELLIKNEKISMIEFYEKIGYKILDEYGSLTSLFNEVLTDEEEAIKNKILQEPLGKSLIGLIKEKIKLPELKLDAIIHLQTKEQQGLEKIKEVFKKTEEFAKKQKYKINVKYISAPKYSLSVVADSYKGADKILQSISEIMVSTAKAGKIDASWQKKS